MRMHPRSVAVPPVAAPAPETARDDRPWDELEVTGEGVFLAVAVDVRGVILGVASWDEFRERDAKSLR
jgi:hypothetical protein